jgi:hypothetical protein
LFREKILSHKKAFLGVEISLVENVIGFVPDIQHPSQETKRSLKPSEIL